MDMFLDESHEHLQSLNDGLLSLEDNMQDTSVVNEIFRNAHTLKGMSATMGYNKIAELTHEMEDVLDLIRKDQLDLNEDIIDIESNIIPYVNTLLSNSTGVAGMRVNDGDEQASVENASQTANTAALNGKRWIAIKSQLDLQDFSTVAGGRAEDMLLAMQSIDNIRLGTFGVENGGIFEKKAHMLNAEAAMNTGTSGLIMDDGLVQRQNFCTICNSLAPFAMWCEINETAASYDRDMDGMIGGDDPQAEATQNMEVTGDGNE